VRFASTGGGGANSGSEVQRQLTAEDGRRIGQNWGRVNLEAAQRLLIYYEGGGGDWNTSQQRGVQPSLRRAQSGSCPRTRKLRPALATAIPSW
jgi:hypothetical protein